MMIEQEKMETPVIDKPRVAYYDIIHNVDGHKDLSMRERVEIKAIDIMVDALMQEEDIEAIFGGMTLANSSRLTNNQDPNYQNDLLWRVHTPQQFFDKVVSESSDQSKDKGLLARWEERMREIATPDMPKDNDVPDQALAKKLVRDFLAMETSKLALITGSTTGLW